jgi:hypothetical protein
MLESRVCTTFVRTTTKRNASIGSEKMRNAASMTTQASASSSRSTRSRPSATGKKRRAKSGLGLWNTNRTDELILKWKLCKGRNDSAEEKKTTRSSAFVDPWGVSADEYTSLEANLFALSLFPYLLFLWFLSRPETAFPRKALFGFKFLLVFVFATIPAGIYAKVHYQDILANVDWLHGSAESLLTLTNLLIVLGMREGLRDAERENREEATAAEVLLDNNNNRSSSNSARAMTTTTTTTETTEAKTTTFSSLSGLALLVVGAAALVGSSFGDAAVASMATTADISSAESTSSAFASFISNARHQEPANALSLPTWVIHASSLIEWLVAMSLIWNYADVKKRPSYKGLTWGMVTSHASGLAACTFHVFYNAPELNSVVALQAGLTLIGNATMGVAAFRMWQEGKRLGIYVEDDLQRTSSGATDDDDFIGIVSDNSLKKLSNSSSSSSFPEDAALLMKLALVSTAVSAIVKWGSLYVDVPFQPSLLIAYSLILGPTILNINAWKKLSSDPKTGNADVLL